jgi:hypothetical protein
LAAGVGGPVEVGTDGLGTFSATAGSTRTSVSGRTMVVTSTTTGSFIAKTTTSLSRSGTVSSTGGETGVGISTRASGSIVVIPSATGGGRASRSILGKEDGVVRVVIVLGFVISLAMLMST